MFRKTLFPILLFRITVHFISYYLIVCFNIYSVAKDCFYYLIYQSFYVKCLFTTTVLNTFMLLKHKRLMFSIISHFEVLLSTLCFNSLYFFWDVCSGSHNIFKAALFIHFVFFSINMFTIPIGTCMTKAILYDLITLNTLSLF